MRASPSASRTVERNRSRSPYHKRDDYKHSYSPLSSRKHGTIESYRSSATTSRSDRDDEERARKLNEMRSNAEELEITRERRLAEAEKRDKEEREKDRLEKQKASKYGGKAGFIRDVSRRTIDEAELLRRRPMGSVDGRED